ncbi:neuronal acetylcholine receptor subunit alpha-5 isoform X1 [Leptinotarsa decemlineata]|uniref:neuronal acetylcholine receptor subunit alpha-5 isoform X1 n=1 Tax=Leptinotarsa decemlineata TaxID=7539 RepID=UPI003D30CCC6
MLVVLVLLTSFAATSANFYDNNVTDLSKCKIHYSRSGSVYKDFYKISESSGENDTLRLDFHFSVLAPSDAHILLAPSEKVEKGDPVYEIVIGAGGNTFCDIRRKQKSDVRASMRIKGLLSALDPQSFWLHITKDGDIAVGKEGEQLPFISWVDPDPLPLEVISFSTWSGIEAKWYFDCERNNETQEIEKPLSAHARLRRDLLYHYNPYVRPVIDVSTTTNVTMSLQISHIDLNEQSCRMEVTGVTKLMWHDEKLNWDPDDYDGIETLHIFRRDIWQPDLVLYNGVGDIRGILGDSEMIADYKGRVEWNPPMNLKVWCDGVDMGKWPKEIHKCGVILGFMRDSARTTLEFNVNKSSLIFHSFSEWSVIEADVISGISLENTFSEPAILQVTFTLKRTSNIVEILLFSPFVVISISLLASFWMDPLGKTKITLTCSQLILTTIMLLALAKIVPSHSQNVPFLVTLYSFTMIALVVALAIAVIVVNLSRNRKNTSVPLILSKMLTNKVISCTLFLPKINMSEEYGKLNETGPSKSQENSQITWIILSLAIDRVAFVVYVALIAFAGYSKY